jgi:tRNA(Ile)-lysidine synthase
LHGTTGSVISLPREISAEKTYEGLLLRPGGTLAEPAVENFDYRVKIPGKTHIPELSLWIRTIGPEKLCDNGKKAQFQQDSCREIFDYDRIHGDLHARNRRWGDKFQPLGMSGMKKLKDFFIDEKIPRAMRDRVLILSDDEDILWVVGYRMDDRFKVTADTKKKLTVMAVGESR